MFLNTSKPAAQRVGLGIGALLVSLLFGAFFAAPVRYVAGIPLTVSFCSAAFIGIIICLSFFRRVRTGFDGFALLRITASALVLFYYSVQRLYHPGFLGFPNLGCADGGNHLMYQRLFLGEEPHVYAGLVSLYGFTTIVESLLNLRAFEAFRFSFYFSLFFLLMSAAITADLLIPALSSRSRAWMLYGVWIVLSLVTLETTVLPALHYFQGDGFWPQIFGLLPLFLAVGFYVSSADPMVRILALLIWGVLLRFSYGLNLSEYLVTAGVLIFLEYRSADHKRKRQAGFFAIFACLALAVYSIWKLTGVFTIPGEIRRLDFVSAALALALVALFGMLFFLHRRRLASSRCNAAEGRLVTFLLVYNLSTLAVFFALTAAARFEIQYYAYKFFFTGIILNCLCVPALIVSYSCSDGVSGSKGLFFGRATVLLLILALLPAHRFIAPVYSSYRARATRSSGCSKFTPLTDLEGEKLIERITTERNKKFGGVLVENFAMYHFMNRSLGFPSTHELYKTRPLDPAPGNCVFWRKGLRREHFRLANAKGAIKQLRELQAEPGIESVHYFTNVGRYREVTLMFKCY